MIKSIEFRRFRNLHQKYEFIKSFNVITGLNNGGKTNILEGVRLAFSAVDGSYFRLRKSDFRDSDDSKPIEILVELEYNSIPSLNYEDIDGKKWCGFKIKIRKTKSGKYIKDLSQHNGSVINRDIILDDSDSLPSVYSVPLYRIEDLYTPGLSVGLSTFLDSDEAYKDIRDKSKEAIKKKIGSKEKVFIDLTSAFADGLRIDVTNPLISDEKLFIVDGDQEHSINIGSGYRSIANMFLCTLDDKTNILLIDEIENHIHPSLLRSLIRKLSSIDGLFVISTTHSPVVVNETRIESLIEVGHGSLSDLDPITKNKLNLFLHPGRGEIIVSENIVLVEGYTEELILKDYVVKNNKNWTIVNVAGVMFEPYVRLAHLLGKAVIVVSDDDRSNTKDGSPTARFNNLASLCDKLDVALVQVSNTLETDLYNGDFLKDFDGLLKKKSETKDYMVAKSKRKTEIALKLIEDEVDLSSWHVVRSIESGLGGN